jgi:hypothetical protein
MLSGKGGCQRSRDGDKTPGREEGQSEERKLEFDAVDITSINDRNKRFNEKIDEILISILPR